MTETISPRATAVRDVTGERQRPWSLARHSLALAGRSLIKTRRNPGLLMDALILPSIFLLLFVYLFGGAVAGPVSMTLLWSAIFLVVFGTLAISAYRRRI
jgi:oleandomycin transport system permease protein